MSILCLKSRGHYNFAFTGSTSVKDNYKNYLGELTASTAFAYERGGTYRVMFYNILWGNSADSYNIPAGERNILQAKIIEQYMPDVIGMQEVDKSKRSNQGDNSIEKLLKALGYDETISPEVNNNSKMNCTPIFYNTATTKYIDGAFYWYKAQDSGAGSGDRDSKALTWGVFESKITGDRYIVFSTHMCTRNADVRLEQAKEAVALIKSVLSQYDYPLIFGGDFNALANSDSHRYFLSSGGFEEAVKIAETSSQVKRHHPYPNYSEKYKIMRPTEGANLDNLSSVDHILITNADYIETKVFGVVVDDYTLSASDHLPLFIDFNIKDNADYTERY